LKSGITASAPVTTAVYQNSLNSAMSGLDNALNNVLRVRADLGARLKEVDTAQGTSDDLSLQYGKTLSGMQDLDYAKAISDLNAQQVYLQAAQQAFLKITSLSLFGMLS
jgi:flagellar hook-associated protein 3 FlgL